jgi:hypothetical protein
VRRLTAVGVAAVLSAAAVGCSPTEDEVAHRATVEVGYASQGVPKGFDAIAARDKPNGLDLASLIDIVWLDADGTRLLLDHLDGVCSEHVSTDVVEYEDRVVVTMVDEFERVESAEPRADGLVLSAVCPSVGVQHRSGVELASPLGSRDLVVQTERVVVPAQDG